MANKYELRKFEPVNNKTYQFQEVSVNGKYLFQEFVENLKDQRDIKKLINIYSYMDMLSASMLPKSKFRHIEGLKRNDVYEFKKDDIRVYVIMQRPSVFVVLGAYKGTQNKDIKRIDKLFDGL